MKKRVLIGFLIFAAICTIASGKDETPPTPPPAQVEPVAVAKTPEQIHTEWVTDQFSPWDGSHIYLVDLVKENLNNPKSFEHVETKYRVENENVIIYMKYRAENGFGAIITKVVKAEADYKENVVTVLEEE